MLYSKEKYMVTANLEQTTILCLFNEKDTFRFDEMIQKTNIQYENLLQTLGKLDDSEIIKWSEDKKNVSLNLQF